MSRALTLLAGLLLTGAGAGCDPGVTDPVAESGGMMQVGVGSEHTCGLSTDGSLFCWGEGRWGRLGLSNEEARSTPARILWDVRLSLLSVGGMHTCGVAADGTAYCWGVNTDGQVGNGGTITQAAPVPVATSVRFTQIAAGLVHTCAVDLDNAVHCWGANSQAQAGGPDARITTPRRVELDRPVSGVSAGAYHSCALGVDGEAWCWGDNSFGQLGDGSTQDRAAPQRVAGEARFSSLSAGFLHTCGVTVAGSLLCWGSSVHGELGTGAVALPGLAGSLVPEAVHTESMFSRVAAGHHTTCGITMTDEVWCWGRGGDGQLGNGSAWDAWTPQPVHDGDPARPLRVQQVDIGVTHACAVSTRNVAFCWGRGDRGQLGARNTIRSTMAIRVREQP